MEGLISTEGLAAGAALLAALVAIWQAVYARSQAKSARVQADSAQQSRDESETLLRAVQAQVIEARRLADAEVRNANAAELQASALARQLEAEEAAKSAEQKSIERLHALDFIDAAFRLQETYADFITWYVKYPTALGILDQAKCKAMADSVRTSRGQFDSAERRLESSLTNEKFAKNVYSVNYTVWVVAPRIDELVLPPRGKREDREAETSVIYHNVGHLKRAIAEFRI